MSTAQTELGLRLAAADPGRHATVDEDARRKLWEQLIADADPRAGTRRRGRIGRWLRRRAIAIPMIAAIGGAALGAQPAWCAPCNHARHEPVRLAPPVGISAAPAVGAPGPAALPAGIRGHSQRAKR